MTSLKSDGLLSLVIVITKRTSVAIKGPIWKFSTDYKELKLVSYHRRD